MALSLCVYIFLCSCRMAAGFTSTVVQGSTKQEYRVLTERERMQPIYDRCRKLKKKGYEGSSSRERRREPCCFSSLFLSSSFFLVFSSLPVSSRRRGPGAAALHPVSSLFLCAFSLSLSLCVSIDLCSSTACEKGSWGWKSGWQRERDEDEDEDMKDIFSSKAIRSAHVYIFSSPPSTFSLFLILEWRLGKKENCLRLGLHGVSHSL